MLFLKNMLGARLFLALKNGTIDLVLWKRA